MIEAIAVAAAIVLAGFAAAAYNWRLSIRAEQAAERDIPPADAWESVAEEVAAPEPVDEAARLACKEEIIDALRAGEAPEAAVERLHAKRGIRSCAPLASRRLGSRSGTSS